MTSKDKQMTVVVGGKGKTGRRVAERLRAMDLFRFLLDGHNANVTGDVERVLGRPPRDVRDFARTAAEVLR